MAGKGSANAIFCNHLWVEIKWDEQSAEDKSKLLVDPFERRYFF